MFSGRNIFLVGIKWDDKEIIKYGEIA